MQITKTITKFYKKNNIWTNLILLLFLIILIKCLFNKLTPIREGFSHETKYIIKQGPDVFDNFYANYYDELTFNYSKNLFCCTYSSNPMELIMVLFLSYLISVLIINLIFQINFCIEQVLNLIS